MTGLLAQCRFGTRESIVFCHKMAANVKENDYIWGARGKLSSIDKIMKSKVLPPSAPILVESTRSIGYSFESAIADIIDNSIAKDATEVYVNFSSNSPQYLAIIDNGTGMSIGELELAMTYGSRSSLEKRDSRDLGRFGLGLKTASLSQCRKLTVVSKKNGDVNAASWDIDHIIKCNDWATIWYSPNEIKELPFSEELYNCDSGTIVIWQQFDRIADASQNPQKVFDEKISRARNHVALVFHRFMDFENINKRLRIYFNGDLIEPIDPYLRSNFATQPLPEQTIRLDGAAIKVKPYILPFSSKVSAEERRKLGDLCDLRSNQGFYIYRNKRLIIWGTWFRLIKIQELNKLARVCVDIPNSLDSIWEIDVKKSTASLPEIIKRNLVAIVENTIGGSERVYKYRGRKTSHDNIQHIWNTIENRGKYQYLINRETPLYKALEDSLDDDSFQYLDAFVKAVEDSFPFGDVYYRLAKDEDSIDKKLSDFDSVYASAESIINAYKSSGLDISTFIASIDKIDYFAKYPDVIQKIKENYSND